MVMDGEALICRNVCTQTRTFAIIIDRRVFVLHLRVFLLDFV